MLLKWSVRPPVTASWLRPPRRLCFRRRLSVCLLATLRKTPGTDLHEIFREGWQWASASWLLHFA